METPPKPGNLNTIKLSPRFGIAWKLNDKTTIRGGYGLFWAPLAYGLQTPLGWNGQSTLTGSGDNRCHPWGHPRANPYPNGLLQPGPCTETACWQGVGPGFELH
ncbi:MAG: hypothetical protein U5J83_03950 [Bryobacterales bacterium]|nr:hypothetical protein [Bryobacterales bacterium]